MPLTNLRSLTKPTNHSRIEWVTIAHSVTGVLRRFCLYLPAGFGEAGDARPVLYLFRGHESEWTDRQDGREGLVRILDRMIARGQIDPMVVCMPGFMPNDRRSQGCPIDWSEAAAPRGLGNGRMEAHFFEIKRFVETHLPVRLGKKATALDGFSMGGFSSVLLAARYPHFFGSVGAFDGSFMWRGQIDPRRRPRGRFDRLWFSDSCAPFFRGTGGWDLAKMERTNPVALIETANPRRQAELRTVRFHVRSVKDESRGNIDRARMLIDVLASAGVANTFSGPDVVLHPEARHDWRWADVHIEGTLRLHDGVFRAG